MTLEVGDKLTSDSRNLIVKIRCGSASVTLASPFRTTFISNDGKNCFTGYESSSGTMVLKSSAPTSVESGPTRVSTKRTEYEIQFGRAKWSLFARVMLFPFLENARVNVFEGEVMVESPGFSTTIKQQKKLTTLSGRTPVTVGIEPADIQRVAGLYARVDVSYMSTNNPQELKAAFQGLLLLHERVLLEPNDQQLQINLANEQKRMGIPATEIGATREDYQSEVTLSPQSVFVNNSCKKKHKFRVTLENLPFVKLLTAEFEIVGGGKDQVRLEVDSKGLKAGDYQGMLIINCLDCSEETNCALERQRVEVIVNIKDKPH